jgi:hypothetical protein
MNNNKPKMVRAWQLEVDGCTLHTDREFLMETIGKLLNQTEHIEGSGPENGILNLEIQQVEVQEDEIQRNDEWMFA